MEEEITIKIPTELAGKLAARMEEAGFDKLTEYITFILNQVLEGEEEIPEDENEEKEVREKLKELGYL